MLWIKKMKKKKVLLYDKKLNHNYHLINDKNNYKRFQTNAKRTQLFMSRIGFWVEYTFASSNQSKQNG